VFGGFTPIKWESRQWNEKQGNENNCWNGDDSLQSFLFTLRNPHGVPPRKFALRKDKKECAIYCYAERCEHFDDIRVWNNCNTNGQSGTYIGTHWGNTIYENDTCFEYFFTGAENFTVKDIEVFEITE
jgi:hypothetical protein